MQEYDKTSQNQTLCLVLNNKDISNKYTITVRKKFDTLQEITETLTPKDEYENFNVHMRAAAECIPTKPKAKQSFTGDNSSKEKKNR